MKTCFHKKCGVFEACTKVKDFFDTLKAGIKVFNTCLVEFYSLLYSLMISSTSSSADCGLAFRTGASMVGSGAASSGLGSITVSSASSSDLVSGSGDAAVSRALR